MENSLAWSKDEHSLSDFVKTFSLPQLVKVEQGHLGNDEETSLSAGQIMTLQSMRKVDTIVAKDIRKRTVYIPRNCNQKVELVMKEAWNRNTVAELRKYFPNSVRVVSKPETDENVNFNVGDKLVLKRKKKKYLKCEKQNGEQLRLPMNLQARLVPLYDGNEYLIHQVIKMFVMPVMVQFIDNIEGKNNKAKSIFSSSLGILTLEKELKEESVVCSTGELNSAKRHVLTIPTSLKVTVVAVNSATTEGKHYESLWKDSCEGINLAKVDALEEENVYASPQEIRGYMQLSLFRAQSTRPNLPGPAKNLEERCATSSEYASLAISRGTTPGVKEFIDAETLNSSSSSNYYTTLDKRPVSSDPCYAKIVSKIEPEERDEDEYRNKKESGRNVALKPKSTLIHEHSVDLTSFSVNEVAQLLAKNKLGAFVKAFKEENIDGKVLLELNKDSLIDLGLNNFQAHKLLMVIHGWKPKIKEAQS